MQKWIALSLIATGVALWVYAYNVDKTASFDDGSFIGEIGLILLGLILVVVGIVWLGVLMFIGI